MDEPLFTSPERETLPTPVRQFTLSVPVAILIGAAMISGSVLYSGAGTRGSLTAAAGAGDSATAPTVVDPATLVSASDPVLGNADAPVTIVEFSDFQCPYCRQFWVDTYPQLKKNYIDTGKAKLVYRNFPLPFHPEAEPAALAGDCANDQGKFWQFHDIAFTQQQKKEPTMTTVTSTISFSDNDIKQWAQQTGLDMQQFNSCFDSAQHKADVDADTAVGSQSGVSGTPSFFINGQLIIGAQPYEVFQQMIDQELAKK